MKLWSIQIAAPSCRCYTSPVPGLLQILSFPYHQLLSMDLMLQYLHKLLCQDLVHLLPHPVHRYQNLAFPASVSADPISTGPANAGSEQECIFVSRSAPSGSSLLRILSVILRMTNILAGALAHHISGNKNNTFQKKAKIIHSCLVFMERQFFLIYLFFKSLWEKQLEITDIYERPAIFYYWGKLENWRKCKLSVGVPPFHFCWALIISGVSDLRDHAVTSWFCSSRWRRRILLFRSIATYA